MQNTTFLAAATALPAIAHLFTDPVLRAAFARAERDLGAAPAIALRHDGITGLPGITGITGQDEMHNFAIRSQRQILATGTAPPFAAHIEPSPSWKHELSRF